MKNLAFFTCLLLLTKLTFAQKDSLAFDDKGKYIYYKVAAANNKTADVTYRKSLGFVKSADNKDLKLALDDEKNMALAGSGVFMVYKPSLAKHPEGQIAFQFKIEVKGDKYRYWLTDFVYTQYYRDRYNNYVPKTGVDVPLEKTPINLSEKDKNQYLDNCATYARQFGDKLKAYLTKESLPALKKDTTARKVIHVDKW